VHAYLSFQSIQNILYLQVLVKAKSVLWRSGTRALYTSAITAAFSLRYTEIGDAGGVISIATIAIAKFGRERDVANQLFRVLPSSNEMGAEDKFNSGSQFGKKGACQWNHSSQPPDWLAAPAAQRHLATVLQFLIANPELEFNLSPERISKLKISNRKYMTIFHSENWVASELRRLPRANSWHKSSRSQSCRKFPWPPWRLIATFDTSEIESTSRKQTSKQISNSNKNAFFASREILRDAVSACCLLHDGHSRHRFIPCRFTP
jgi:hypothetical protein